MRVLLVEPYYGGSHAAWADGYAASSSHEVILATHDARFWKWRMQGSHLTLADAVSRIDAVDVILATDMLNLPSFLGAARRTVGGTPAVLYMHENQLTYPASPRDSFDHTYGMINWGSMLAAAAVVFNSEFHRGSALGELPRFLRQFPDYRHDGLLEDVVAKTEVLAVGVDLPSLEPIRDGGPPVVLWNHRWEYDKRPDRFFSALNAVSERGISYRVAVCGESFGGEEEPAFDSARSRLGDRVIHWGFTDRETYWKALARSDIVVSTADQEFFGIAITEAMHAGAMPVLPNRLVYPERIPGEIHDVVLYEEGHLVDGLARALTDAQLREETATITRRHVGRYDWAIMAPRYDDLLERVVNEAQ